MFPIVQLDSRRGGKVLARLTARGEEVLDSKVVKAASSLGIDDLNTAL